jgi:NADH dehydrogenase/NADH:ubiquinone oxidoreductase subunit G
MHKIFFDQQECHVPDGLTILEAAAQNGIDIPTICWHPATSSNGLCRLCVVEVEGMRVLQPACIVKTTQGMKIHTQSQRVNRARKTILEMLASSVDLSDAPEILALMDKYQASATRFPYAERHDFDVIDDNPMYIRDYAKCVLCWRCVQVCAEDAQFTYAINFGGRGYETHIDTFYQLPILATTCVLCGQCVGVCPSGALKPRREYLLELGQSPEQISVMNTGRKSKQKRRGD